MYAIGATTAISKAIDHWIDDYDKHGGNITERNIVGSQIMPGWGVRVRRRFAERGIKIKSGGLDKTIIAGKGTVYLTPIKRSLYSPDSDSSPDVQTGYINNLRQKTPDGDGDDLGDDENGDAPRDEDEENLNRRRQRASGDKDFGKEFRLASPRNIIINTFIGKNLHSNPYFIFNNQIRRLIMTMGKDGDELLEILDEIEKLGNQKLTKGQLERFAKEILKIYEYDRAVEAALPNWTVGLAQGLVQYANEGGLDAWRKMYNK